MSKRNILKENMNRFGTKNLVNEHVLGQLPSEKLMKMKWNPLTEEEYIEEQDAIPPESEKIAKIVAKVNQNMATMRQAAKSVNQYMGDTSSRKKVTPEQLMKKMTTGQPALIMTADGPPEYLLVIIDNNLYELV